MFYKFIRPIARFIVWLLNGHLHVYNKQALPKGTYILVAPHRTWWDLNSFVFISEFIICYKCNFFSYIADSFQDIDFNFDFCNYYG